MYSRNNTLVVTSNLGSGKGNQRFIPTAELPPSYTKDTILCNVLTDTCDTTVQAGGLEVVIHNGQPLVLVPQEQLIPYTEPEIFEEPPIDDDSEEGEESVGVDEGGDDGGYGYYGDGAYADYYGASQAPLVDEYYSDLQKEIDEVLQEQEGEISTTISSTPLPTTTSSTTPIPTDGIMAIQRTADDIPTLAPIDTEDGSSSDTATETDGDGGATRGLEEHCFEYADYLGNDVGGVKVSSPKGCQLACQEDDRCLFFTYLPRFTEMSSVNCWLKATDQGRVLRWGGNNPSVSGPKTCRKYVRRAAPCTLTHTVRETERPRGRHGWMDGCVCGVCSHEQCGGCGDVSGGRQRPQHTQGDSP